LDLKIFENPDTNATTIPIEPKVDPLRVEIELSKFLQGQASVFILSPIKSKQIKF
jgi:hypothetical protein